MSFQAYMDNIEEKTGFSPEQFLSLGEEKGFVVDGKINPAIKVGEIVDWLKSDYGLGHGHAMAIVAYFKGKRK
ncbi:DUF4287 domain-containing protein [Parvularcula flava]|uniref:DUF4287 domain-containing protein n=1 Tax=Aquisalinus luteolus TaxID=1566827 RepID=A0A8J3A8D7_9PROT|nr:DUF4287 domain-containing protein [Aquisalinus luteolus]NHK28397.1 DUF4287 domain-containing protein [Aquisalinus luteolus]GGH98352.1 hypothetical protein GCM10011355_21740 [Aquisalinus luteolus]